MKRFFTVLLALILVLATLMSFASCRESGNDENVNNDQNNENNENNENNVPDGGTEGGETTKNMSVKEMLETLAASPYQNAMTLDGEVAIDDVSKVGVDKEKFDNEMLYPYPDDSEFGDRVYVVTDHGVVKDGDRTSNQLSTDNQIHINALFQKLKTVEGKKKVVFPQGNYYFNGPWHITDLDDVYICSDEYGKFFNIVYTDWKHAIQVTGGSNIHLRDYTLTYDPSSAIGGEIVRYDTAQRTVTVKIYEEFDMTRSVYNNGMFYYPHSYMEFIFDEATGEYIPDPNGNLLYGSSSKQSNVFTMSYDNDTRELVLKLSSMAEPFIGKRVNIAYTQHQFFGFSASDCKSVYLEHINIYTACGMGFGFTSIDDVYMNQVKIDLDPNSKRLMTCTADALHSTDTLRMTITNCAFKYSHDDALNVKSWYKNVDGIQSNTVTCSGGILYPFEEGQEIEIFDESNFELIGTYTVKKILSTNGSSYKLRVDRTIGEGKTLNGKYLLANTSRGTRLTFKNNVVGNKRNRGIMIQCRESVIENNTFMNVVHGVLNIYTIRDSASEGICPKDITIANNKFIHNRDCDINFYTSGSSGSSVGVMRNVYIFNNFFTNAVNTPIVMQGAGDTEIHNNIFYDVALNVHSQSDGNAAINIQTGKNISVYDNSTYMTEKKDGFHTLNFVGSKVEMAKNENNKAFNGKGF